MKALQTVIVAAGVVVEDGRVLVTKRKAGAHLEGLWEFPGGKVEPGEDPRVALVRELDEELGIACTIGDIIEVEFHHYADAAKAVLLLFYEAVRTGDSPSPTIRDVADFRWASESELREDVFPPADIGVLKKVRARLRANITA